jgi:type IV secretory pathway VirB9-like protein
MGCCGCKEGKSGSASCPVRLRSRWLRQTVLAPRLSSYQPATADLAAIVKAQPVATGLSLENLHFRYAITSDNPAWRPQRVFDDGAKVYIEFPSSLDQGEAPPLFVIGPQG